MTKRVGLIQARKGAGYTQESFAEALGVDRTTVARWKAGGHEPLPYLRPKITRLLSVSSSRTVSRIQSLQQQIRPLQSVSLTELDEEITVFLRSAHDDEDLTT